MISAGTGSVKQQFYEKGSLEAIDWGEVAGKSTVGGIIGVGTSYGGAKLSQGTTYLLSKNATVSSLLYSESAATRAASNFVVSGTTEVVSGGITRFAGGVLTTGGNVKEAWAQAINPQSILFDATLGASMGGVKGLQKPQKINANLNSPEQSNADVKPLENTVKHQDSLEKESKFVNSTDKVALKNDSTKIASYIEDSGWSSDIVEKIDNDEQYDIYKNADLHEEEVNGRKCLVKDIDFDYVDEKTGMTNKELMEKGRSPIDSKTGEKIELHHMGQDYDSPFAELDENSEHGDGNHKVLHPKTDNSWRNDKDLKNRYQTDRKKHWKQRSTEA